MTDWGGPPAAQVTVTGQLPRVVLVPTFHVQDATPPPFAVVGPSPPAVDAPDAYTTTMLHAAPGSVVTVAVELAPRATGDVSEVKVSDSVGCGVGTGVDCGVGAAAGSGVAIGAAECTGVSVAATVVVGGAADTTTNTPDAVGVEVGPATTAG